MLLSLRNDHKEHLNLLTKQPQPVIIDFCKLAIDFLQNGSNVRLYVAAAEKLGVNVDDVQNCVYGILNLLLLSCKNNLSGADFRDSVLTLGFTKEQEEIVSKLYSSKKSEICKTIKNMGVNELHFNDLHWRFEIQVATRTLLHQATPLITINLNLRTENKNLTTNYESILFQIDPTNIQYIANELERALNESKRRQSRKIQKMISNN